GLRDGFEEQRFAGLALRHGAPFLVPTGKLGMQRVMRHGALQLAVGGVQPALEPPFHETCGEVEGGAFNQRVEDRALECRLRLALALGGDVATDPSTQLLEGGELTDILGELVVELRDGPPSHTLDVDLEHGLLTRQVTSPVILWKMHCDFAPLPRPRTDQLRFKSWQEAVGAELNRNVLSASTLERRATHAADEINVHDVRGCCLRPLRFLDDGCALLAQALEGTLYILDAHFDDGPPPREATQFRQLEGGL